MTTDPKPMCKARIWRPEKWRSVECTRPAATEAGFCRIHDPELRKQRAAKRGPTMFERQQAGREEFDAALAELRAMGQDELAKRICRAALRMEFG